MKTNTAIAVLIAIVVVAGAAWYFMQPAAPTVSNAQPPAPASSAGTYVDAAFGFSFAYPKGEAIVEKVISDTENFPGAIAVKSIQVGEAGGVTVFEVTSANGTITDEPNNHASPIAQTKYFYDPKSQWWMVAYPEGRDDGSSAATSTATASGRVGEFGIFDSGRRFDTKIIPLSPTKFVVVTSGGGSSTADIVQSILPVQ